MIGAPQIFDQAFLVAGADGGPNYSTMTVVLYLYNKAIASVQFGYAAAVGVVLFVGIFAITVVQRLLFGRPEVGVTAERPVGPLSELPPGVVADELSSTGEVAIGAPVHAQIPGRGRAEQVRTVVIYLVLTLTAILFAVPFLWSVLTSFKPLSETLSFTFLPKTWTVPPITRSSPSSASAATR